PSVWGANAAQFEPERWITPGGVPPPSALPHGWSGLVTFCDGPRNCIGYRLGECAFARNANGFGRADPAAIGLFVV
ncbi:hypothetical protein OBBRIDRAFT_742916, partial [Obba rivulosa]